MFEKTQWDARPTTLAAMPGNTNAIGIQAERVLALDEITQQVQRNNTDLAECIALLSQFADSLTGSRPQAASAKDAPPQPSGRIYGLARHVRDTEEILRILREEIERLRGI